MYACKPLAKPIGEACTQLYTFQTNLWINHLEVH
jgi:hypothetical protein